MGIAVERPTLDDVKGVVSSQYVGESIWEVVR